MEKCISILGSTGSIGVQTLGVVRNLGIRVKGLTADKNIDLLEKQAREFKPKAVSISCNKQAEELRSRLGGLNIEVYSGAEGLIRIATLEGVDTVVNSLVGIAGLMPTMEAIRNKKSIALANKETLVAAGSLVMAEAKRHSVEIIPIDSEHSAIFQCIMGNNKANVSKLILTASGGPFRGCRYEDLIYITPEEALKHPNWQMGNKITIDSATLMNKGLEVIEARWLFDINEDNIKVLIHPQSIIHSMVEYIDGSVIAQLGPPDMRIPIQFALTYPERSCNNFPKLNLAEKRTLTFEEPDYKVFPCLNLAYEALKASGTMPAAMSGANEMAVWLFLNKKIKFTHIPELIEKVMEKHKVNNNPSINDIIEVDTWAKEEAAEICGKGELLI
ncbi:MAG: 1-deoxy-D-xylulose-5-phosphate reductoisomerase [Firmicutes bacterium]|nr:1-deoxy-D-xylulose-5-phosphate reductoisomerase [Bacillota bacterium]